MITLSTPNFICGFILVVYCTMVCFLSLLKSSKLNSHRIINQQSHLVCKSTLLSLSVLPNLDSTFLTSSSSIFDINAWSVNGK